MALTGKKERYVNPEKTYRLKQMQIVSNQPIKTGLPAAFSEKNLNGTTVHVAPVAPWDGTRIGHFCAF